MRRAAYWTIGAFGLLLLAIFGSVCPPAAHIPVIVALISLTAFLIALLEAVRSIRSNSGSRLVATAALCTIQLLGIAFIGWALVITSKAGQF
jgi:hypothetical protein